MKYLIDFSSLCSMSKGLGSYGFQRYLNEEYGTEGITQLLDIAKLINLYVLSDEISVSERLGNVNLPRELENAISYVSLSNNLEYYADFEAYTEDIVKLKPEIDKIEKLLGLRVIEDFVYEIEDTLTYNDSYFVEQLASKFANLITIPENATDSTSKQKYEVFWSLVARAFQYLQTSETHSIPYICHIYRSPIVRIFNPCLTISNYNLYTEFEFKLRKWLKENLGNHQLEFNLPMFFTAVLRECKSPNELFIVAQQYRESKSVRRIREIYSEIVDQNNRIDLLKYVELHRALDGELQSFHKKYTPNKEKTVESTALKVELSASLGSIGVKASIDILKISRGFKDLIEKMNNRRRIGFIFKTARKLYEELTIEYDLERIWKIKLTERHKNIIRQISEYCDV